MSSGEAVLNVFYCHKRNKSSLNLKRINATITVNTVVKGAPLSDYGHHLVP